MDLSTYRVRSGPVRLADWDPRGPDQDREAASERIAALRDRMLDLQERLYAEHRQSLLVVLQARDAGGKDGTVKHVFRGLNPQGVTVVSFKAPTPEETAHDFLWRVHRHAPQAGYITIFNRSHYEDVLVPRVRGTLDEAAARRRLEHIRAFEALLHDHGTRLLKLYLHLSPEEQLRRLRARLENPEKHWKFDPGDLRDRAAWDDYTRAYEDAMGATSTQDSPWYVIPADRKWLRNLLVMELIVTTLEAMEPRFPEPTFDPAGIRLED